MAELIYKIFRSLEWDEVRNAGTFEGSADDRRDGFLHFSSAHQVKTTYDRHFAGEDNLILAAVDAARLGNALKWEVSRGGEKFPHLYGALRVSDIEVAVEIRRGAKGRPIFPPEIP